MIVCKNISKVYRHAGHSKQVFGNVDLVVEPGDRLALLGRNGAGKTTLIKLIGGVEMPTSGRISRKMSVSWPLGFAGGFQGSLTGYDNAKFIARIYDRDYSKIRGFVEDFTELGRQLAMPVKTYSSGMRARLAFALSIAIEFECYLIDEVLLVGDQNFNRKCHYELFEKRKDRTMILASHSPPVIRQLCNRAAIIHNRRLIEHNDVEEAVQTYVNL
jgi:capsular polysaccharide transport system ATP-binding protein